MLALLALLVLAPSARAEDTYTVHYCRAPGGGLADTTAFSDINPKARLGRNCPAEGVSAGPPIADFSQLEGFSVRYAVPASTRLVGFDLYRTVTVSAGWNYSLYPDTADGVDANIIERCWWGACSGLGDGTVSPASRVSQRGIDRGGLDLYIDCNPGPCAAGSQARVTVHRLDAILADRTDPAFTSTPSGDLLDSSHPIAGRRSVSFAASDTGGGVYQATIEVDGRAAVTQGVDSNGGRCRRPFTTPTPCRGSAAGTISLDTATLPDGAHSVRLLVSDATGSNRVVFGPVPITTRNQAAICDPAIKANVTPVSASFTGKRRRRAITRRRGRGARVAGRLAGAGAGAEVLLLAREARVGAPATLAARTTTRADGSFTLRVPAGRSRTLRAAHRISPTAPFVACSRALRLRVPARATLRVRPKRVRAGRSVRLSGRLLGGRVPRRGKTVDLQGYERGRWRTFDTARSTRRGRYRARYRFSGAAAGRSFRLRVRVRPDAAYPFAVGYSRAVRVRVG